MGHIHKRPPKANKKPMEIPDLGTSIHFTSDGKPQPKWKYEFERILFAVAMTALIYLLAIIT